MKRISIFKNFNYNLVAVLVSNAVFAFGISILSRKLGPVAFGEVNSFIAFIAMFLPLIIHGSSTYYMREYSKNDNEEEIKRFFNYTLLLFILLTLVFSIFFTFSKMYEISMLAKIIYVILICFSQAIDLQWVYRAKEATQKIAICLSVTSVINLCLVLVFLPVMTPEIYLYLVGFTKVLNSVLIIIVEKSYRKYFTFIILSFTSILKFKPIKGFFPVLILSLSGLLNLVYIKSDLVMLSYFGFDLEAGYYSSAYTIITLVFIIRATLLSVLMPSLIKTYNKNIFDFQERLTVYLKVGATLGIIVTGLIYFSNELIVSILFGQLYLEAIPVLNILLIMNLIVFFNMGLSASLVAIGKDKEFLFATLLAATLNIVGNFIFIPYFNMYAAAITTLLSELTIIIMSLIILHQGIYDINIVKVFIKNIIQFCLFGFIAVFITVVEQQYLQDTLNVYILQIINSIIFVSIFMFLILISKKITKPEISLLMRVYK